MALEERAEGLMAVGEGSALIFSDPEKDAGSELGLEKKGGCNNRVGGKKEKIRLKGGKWGKQKWVT